MSKIGSDVIGRKKIYIPPTTYTRKGKRIHRKGYYKTDVGAPGRGKPLIPIEGELDGYTLKAGTATRRRVILRCARKYGYASTKGKLWALVQLHKRTNPQYSRTARQDFNWFVENYGAKAGFPLGK